MPSVDKIELRPPALLVVGITGHRSIGIESAEALAVDAALDALLRELHAALKSASAADRALFSDAEPILRLVGMAADGTDLLGARAARALGAEISCVLPFAPAEYANDFSSPAARELARTIIADARSVFVLPGERDEGARAYERANNVILSNIDLLIAVWDGTRAQGRAGTGDIAQSAVSFGIPVIAIDPRSPARPKFLFPLRDDQLETSIATDRYRAAAGLDVPSLLQQIIAPPSGSDKRQGLRDLYDEKPGRRTARFEYPLLLKLFGAARVVRAGTAGKARTDGAEPADRGTNDEPRGRLAELEKRTRAIDEFSIHYAGLFRSSNASAFLLIILAALISGTLSFLFPGLFGISIVGQMVVNGLVLIDATIATKRRWHERWLDYRLIAERLRCLRFLHPLGLSLERAIGSDRKPGPSWVEWYVRRIERALGAPAGRIRPADLARLAQRLAHVEIGEQAAYHRNAFRQLRILERRLAAVATLTLLATIAVAAAFGLFAYYGSKSAVITWRPLAVVLLLALPAATSAFRGLRAEADMVRLAERSATAAVALERLRRAIGSVSPTYERVAVAAMRAAAIMGAELSDWRFVLERRRSRARRPPMLGRSRRWRR